MNSIRSSVLFAFCFFFALPVAQAQLEHEFVGAKRCSICHKTPEHGEQFGIWQKSKHAHAIESLRTPEAKEIGAKMGIENPETSGKCLKCHSTAYGFSEEKVTDAIAVEEGVSCESCHGPGKDYAKKSVMQDRDESVRAGLILPDEQTCRKCHNEGAPTFKGFDYQTMWEKIKHPVPNK